MSVDFMLQLDCDTREKYFRDALHFFQRRYEKENVMYCQCHLDESNPLHIHIVVVPITPDKLEREQYHSKKYLPLQQFKAQQAKIKAQLFADDLHLADISHQKIEEADKTAHFPTKGVIFTSEDRDNIELPIKYYLYLKESSEESTKMAATIHSLQVYTAIPKAWRKNIDRKIDKLQLTFSAYCHDLHRATVRTFIVTKGNFNRTERILHNPILSTDIKDTEKYISDVIHAAILQHKKNIQPTIPPPSWTPSKPSETYYSKSDETGIVPLQLSKVPDINRDMINRDLLSELEKDEIRHKIEVYSR